MAGLELNIVPVEFSSEKVNIGTLRIDKEAYGEIVSSNSETHAFRYDTDKDVVYNIPIRLNGIPLGDVAEVEILSALPLLARVILPQ